MQALVYRDKMGLAIHIRNLDARRFAHGEHNCFLADLTG